MTLVALALAAITALAPDLGEARTQSLAKDITAVVEEGPLPFYGEHAAEASVLALAIIGWHEGIRFSYSVERCWVTAAHGSTVSIYGLMAPWGDLKRTNLCQGGIVPARLALKRLRLHTGAGRRYGLLGGWNGYATGVPWKKSAAARDMCRKWQHLLTEYKVNGFGVDCGPALPDKPKRKPRKGRR